MLLLRVKKNNMSCSKQHVVNLTLLYQDENEGERPAPRQCPLLLGSLFMYATCKVLDLGTLAAVQAKSLFSTVVPFVTIRYLPSQPPEAYGISIVTPPMRSLTAQSTKWCEALSLKGP